MSRFGSTATIKWNENNNPGTFTGSLTISLLEAQMPQYPFEEERETDQVTMRTKTGQLYQYENYNKAVYTWNWSELDESKYDEIKNMVLAMPIFSFSTGGTDFGTFKIVDNSWSAEESSFELYNVSITAEEEV